MKNILKGEQPVHVLRKSLLNMEKSVLGAKELNDKYFGTDCCKLLYRCDIKGCKNIDSLLLGILYWGFPTNQHGICGNVLKSYSTLKKMTAYLRKNPNLGISQYNILVEEYFNEMHGVGLAFLSKLMFFMNVKIDGYPCVIEDQFVRAGIGKSGYEELKKLGYISYRKYPKYIAAISNIAAQENITPEELEYRLWSLGKAI